jgi:hypothetical protein
MGRLIALTVALLAGVLIAWTQVRTPAPAAADAPAAAFSAGRAMATVREIAQVPHPTGSAANRAVRDRLVARMQALGLSPRVRRGDVLAPPRADGAMWGGSPESLIGVLPGQDRTQPAVALMAHYDSRPGAPGAADDAAGVAAVLETVRAIKARGVPARDVVAILTDGEEAGCLCGAREVLANDPVARRLGLVVNLEARGSAGRALMFETGADDGQALRLFRDTAVRPLTGSIFQEVYARLPNDTDFTQVKRAGVPGFNFAFAGGQFDYHQATDTPANLSAGSLQDIGQQTLALAGAAAFASTLPGPAPDVVYGVLLGRAMAVYPPAWGWAPLAAAAAQLALAMARARRRKVLAGADVARGLCAGRYALAAAAAFLHLAGAAAGSGVLGERRLLADAGRFELVLILVMIGAPLFAAAEAARGRRGPAVLAPLLAGLGSCALAGGLDLVGLAEGLVAAALAAPMGRAPAGRVGAWAGVLLLGLAAGAAAQVFAPLAAYMIAWPLALAALAAAATDLAFDRRPHRLALLALAAALAAGWSGVLAHLIVVVAGLPELLVLPLLAGGLALWPLAQPDGGAPPARQMGRVLLLAAAALLLVVRVDEPWSVRRPRPSLVAYQLDQDAGRAWRITPPALATPWSEAALRAEGGVVAPLAHWAWPQPVDATPAPLAAIPAPAVRLERAPDGQAILTVILPPGVRSLALQLAPDAPARLEGAGAATAAADLPAGRWTRLYWSAPPPEGLALRLRPSAPGTLRLRYALTMDGWPPGVTSPPPPPPGVMAVERSDEALITGSRRFDW